MMTTEKDRGMKYDGGKILAAIPVKDFNLAIKAVAEVGTFGANKYKRSSWKTVPDAALRYEDALVRHQLEKEEVDYDEESGLLHLAHMAWNALAILQLKLEEESIPLKDRPYFQLMDKETNVTRN